MKILKYFVRPVKFIAFIGAVLAVLYFRSIIFHGNINQYVDSADSYLEQQFKVDIPEYTAKTSAVIPVVEVIEIIDCVSDDPLVADNNSVPEVSETSQAVVDVVAGKKYSEDHELNVVVDTEKDKLPLIEEKPQQQEAAVIALVGFEENLNLTRRLNETVDLLSQKIDSLIDNAKENEKIVIPAKQLLPENIVSTEYEQKDKVLPTVEEDNKKTIDSSVDAVSSDVSLGDAREIHLEARQMFWNGNAQGSEKLYLDLMAISDDDPDVYGELGNVYYAQGKWRQAGKAYYEAAIRLLKLKKNDQVSYLLRVIQGLDSESADKLRHRLNSKKT